APADAAGQRFVVQVGAFADNARAREVRLRVERAGLKTYTQVADTKDGRRIRVRVGPYASRAEAEKAAVRIKKLDLPAALLTL
ncbi:MAG: SPOR domain-containing protein, partial [Rhodoferax sp.]|nr:SPOR domain-containing protein [Rhodoferax sp.]